MAEESFLMVNPVFVGFVLAFGVAAVACFASVTRARQIEDADTRRGLVGLLLASGGWATAHVAFLLAPTPELKTAAYMAGLIVGFSAVGPWLYFCSAYTGRSLHRNRFIRRSAVAVFVVVVLVKVTNPVHHLYFTTETVSTPFPHLAVRSGLFHWLAMGLAYALAIVGYFMLLELFMRVSYNTKPFVFLMAITGLPIVFEVTGFVSTYLIDITYGPIGVAVFAVGVFYFYIDMFQAIQLAGERDDPVIVLNDENRIRDYNDSAARLFPELTDPETTDMSLEAVLPEIADSLRNDESLVELERGGSRRYYRLTENKFGAEEAHLGRLLTVADITHREQYRQELERQNDRLEEFANMVSHDLRNPLSVAVGRLEIAREENESEHIDAAVDALSRMESIIEDVLKLARQGQPIDETEQVTLSSLADQCWKLVETGTADLVIGDDVTLMADEDRLRQLLENLFRNAVEHGGDGTTVRVAALEGGAGFCVADDGPGIPEEERDKIFESGYSTAEDGTGFGLAIVKEIAEGHGWETRITESDEGGARFEFRGVDVVS